MKKIFTLALVTLLVLSLNVSAVALPPELLALLGGSLERGEYTIQEERLNIYPAQFTSSGEYVAIISNPHDEPMEFSYDSKVDLLDKDGQVVASIDMLLSIPNTIPAGGTGYVQGSIMTLEEEDAQRITSHQVLLTGVKLTPEMEAEQGLTGTVPANAELLVYQEKYVLNPKVTHGGQLLIKIDNNTEATAFSVKTANLLRNKEGKLLTIIHSTAFDVGITAGSSIILKGRIPDGLINLFMSQNTAAETVESFAYYTVGE